MELNTNLLGGKDKSCYQINSFQLSAKKENILYLMMVTTIVLEETLVHDTHAPLPYSLKIHHGNSVIICLYEL